MSNPEALSAAADYFYQVCELYEDDDLDPDDYLEVIRRAFTSSDCDDFAAVLSRMTGWAVVSASWQIPGHGIGHHALVRSPEGRLLDVSGWTDENELRKRFGIGRKGSVSWIEGHISSPMYGEGDEETGLVEGVIQSLPYEPYSDPDFQAALAAATINSAP